MEELSIVKTTYDSQSRQCHRDSGTRSSHSVETTEYTCHHHKWTHHCCTCELELQSQDQSHHLLIATETRRSSPNTRLTFLLRAISFLRSRLNAWTFVKVVLFCYACSVWHLVTINCQQSDIMRSLHVSCRTPALSQCQRRSNHPINSAVSEKSRDAPYHLKIFVIL